MKLGSGAFEGPYSFSSRFEEAKGTNPEELIGAAEAGCFSMALSANLEKAGHPAKRISTTATVKLEMVGGGPKITTIDLKTEAEVPGIDEAKFREQAELTKKTCPVSVALSRHADQSRRETAVGAGVSPAKPKVGRSRHGCHYRTGFYFANSYRYSTNDIVAPSKSWIFGFVDSMM